MASEYNYRWAGPRKLQGCDGDEAGGAVAALLIEL